MYEIGERVGMPWLLGKKFNLNYYYLVQDTNKYLIISVLH